MAESSVMQVGQQFVAVVPYDTDTLGIGNEGCLASDVESAPNYFHFPFTLRNDGYVALTLRPQIAILLAPDGKLFQVFGKNAALAEAKQPLTSYRPLQDVNIDTLSRRVPFDQEFYDCWKQGNDFNKALTDAQRATVDRIFQAVRNTFPQEFLGMVHD